VTDWNFADVWETVADTVPDAPALVHGERRLTWAELEARANGVARVLLELGVAHQDKVAHYLYNGPEYLESTFGILKAGLVPVNTNYRYTDDELVYLWDNADAVAVIFHGTFTERITGVRPRVRNIRSWLWVDDGSGDCPDWATPYEAALTGWRPRGRARATTSTCSTRAAPRACPRASCGARTTSSAGSTAATSCGCPRAAASRASARP
jgi:fatty-acyl-CoA synthase